MEQGAAQEARGTTGTTGGKTSYSFGNIIGSSPRIKEATALAQRVAPTDATVLLLKGAGNGEEGVYK